MNIEQRRPAKINQNRKRRQMV